MAHALAGRGLPPSLILTGQHEGLQPERFGLGDFPAVNLRLSGEEDPHVHVVTGNMRLVGTSTEAIVAETRRILSDPLA